MMLRESSRHSGQIADPRAVTADETVPSGVDGGAELLALASAAVVRDPARLSAARQAATEALGEEALVDAVAVAANFQRMTRIADATGIPLDRPLVMATAGMAADLGISDFDTAQNTPSLTKLEQVASRLIAPLAPQLMKLFQPRQ